MNTIREKIVKIAVALVAIAIIVSAISMFFDVRATEEIKKEQELREVLQRKYEQLENKTLELEQEIETLEEEKVEIEKNLAKTNRRYKDIVKDIDEGNVDEDEFFKAHGY